MTVYLVRRHQEDVRAKSFFTKKRAERYLIELNDSRFFILEFVESK